MIPFVGLSRTTGTVIGPGIELQSVRALTKLTKATEEPLFVFNSLAVWAQALMLNSTRVTHAAGMDLQRFFNSPSPSARSRPGAGWPRVWLECPAVCRSRETPSRHERFPSELRSRRCI